MEWLFFSIALWMALVVVATRLRQRRRARKSLCWDCQYDYLDVCDLPRRPYARECDVYLPIEHEEEDGELDEYEEKDFPR